MLEKQHFYGIFINFLYTLRIQKTGVTALLRRYSLPEKEGRSD